MNRKKSACHEIALLSAEFELKEFKKNEYPPIFSGFEDHEILYILYQSKFDKLIKEGEQKIKEHQNRLNELKNQNRY